MKSVCSSLLGVVLLNVVQQGYSGPVVQTKNGLIEGSNSTTVEGNTPYIKFLGIPYAAPPVGDLRFEPPQSPEPWEGVWNGTEERDYCPQLASLLGSAVGSEDCLYLNVYTTQLPTSESTLKPVIAWVPGGYFLTGSKNYEQYGPDYFLDQDIVFVSMNYRLGPYGFLSTGDTVAAGNNGIKDVVQVLEWIQDNIAQFGGDPNSVTLTGQSSGSAVIHYILQSTTSAGLYHRAITQSGSSLNPWSLSPISTSLAFDLGTIFDITTTDSKNLIENLKQVDYSLLEKGAMNLVLNNLNTIFDGLAWAPVIEKEQPRALQTRASYALLSSGQFNQVPVLLGFASNEMVAFQSLMDDLGLTSELDIPLLAPKDLNADSQNSDAVVQAIKDFYFNSSDKLTSDQIIRYLSDEYFIRGIYKTAQFYSQLVPTYLYKFAVGDDRENVPHSADLPYLFNSQSYAFTPSSQTNLTRSRLVTMWSNFVKYGNPTPEVNDLIQVTWPLANSSQDLAYLNIGDELSASVAPDQAAMKFWDNLYEQYGSPPYVTF